MTAITSCHQPAACGPLRIRPFRPAVRHQPSVAVRRRRATITLVVLAALGVLLGAGSLAGAGQAPIRQQVVAGAEVDALPVVASSGAATTHVVQPGDTLWSLARRLQPEGDVRPLVARLRQAHGPGPLLPGERLRLAV